MAKQFEMKKALQRTQNVVSKIVTNSLADEFKAFDQACQDIEEWVCLLSSGRAHVEASKFFPMTPGDVGRSRKRIVETIAESVEDDEGELSFPRKEDDVEITGTCQGGQADPVPQVRRGSRAASKLANLNMKELRLNIKMRRPSNFGTGADLSSTISVTEPPPSKRPRKGTSNAPAAKTSSATVESSFASAKDSLTSHSSKLDGNAEHGDKKMECGDGDIVSEKIEIRKCSTITDQAENVLSKKSSVRMKTVTVTRTSKRVTKQQITTYQSPATSMPTKKGTIKPQTPDMFDSDEGSSFDDPDDNTPLVSLASKLTNLKRSVPKIKVEQSEAKSDSKNCQVDVSLKMAEQLPGSFVKLVRLSDEFNQCTGKNADPAVAIFIVEEKDEHKVCESEMEPKVAATRDVILKQSPVCVTTIAEDISSKDAVIAKESAGEKVKATKPKALNNATNRNNATPEAIRNGLNRNFEPMSVKKRVEQLEQKIIVGPALPVKPEESVRVTRTKTRAMMANLPSVLTALPEKVQKMETSQLLKLARKSLLKATKISLAKDRKEINAQISFGKENTSPPPRTAKQPLKRSIRSTVNKNRTTPHSYIHPSRLAVAQMSTSKQLININTNQTTFLPKVKVVSAAEEAEEKRKEERRHRRDNKSDALLKKKAMMDDKIDQQRRKREEKEKNVLIQRALLEREKAENQARLEKENEEKERLIQEREDAFRREQTRKKEEAKQKAAKIEERRVRKEAERLQALKLQEEEQSKLQAQKKKEQEDAERLHAKRMLEEKEKKEKEAALKQEKEAALKQDKDAALKQEKLKQAAKKAMPPPQMDSTFVVEKPVARPPVFYASKTNYPLADVSKGNDSDYSDGEEDLIPDWASRENIFKSLKQFSYMPQKALNLFFGSRPTTPNLQVIFPGIRLRNARTSSAVWRTPPRASMIAHQV